MNYQAILEDGPSLTEKQKESNELLLFAEGIFYIGEKEIHRWRTLC